MIEPPLSWAIGALQLALALLLFAGGYIEGQRSVRLASRVRVCAHECLGPYIGRCAWITLSGELYQACTTEEPLGGTLYDHTPEPEAHHG